MLIVMQTKYKYDKTNKQKKKKQWGNVGTIQVGNKETKEYHEYFRAMTEKDDMPLSLLVNNVISICITVQVTLLLCITNW